MLHTKLLARKISDFCRLRVDPVLPPQESRRIREYLLSLIARSQTPPRKLRGYDWDEISLQCDLDKEATLIARAAIEPGLDAIVRTTKSSPIAPFPCYFAYFRSRTSTSPRAPRSASGREDFYAEA
jgi:hypothetical protein